MYTKRENWPSLIKENLYLGGVSESCNKAFLKTAGIVNILVVGKNLTANFPEVIRF